MIPAPAWHQDPPNRILKSWNEIVRGECHLWRWPVSRKR